MKPSIPWSASRSANRKLVAIYFCVLLAAVAASTLGTGSLQAQDGSWLDNAFRPRPAAEPATNPPSQERDVQRAPWLDAPSQNNTTSGFDRPASQERSEVRRSPVAVEKIDRAELAPILPAPGQSTDPLAVSKFGTGPKRSFEDLQIWSGMTVEDIDRALGKADFPPKSQTLARLWRQLWTADLTPSADNAVSQRFQALSFEAMSRSGLMEQAQQQFASLTKAGGSPSAVATLVAARAALIKKEENTACEYAAELARKVAELPDQAIKEALFLRGLCALIDSNTAEAALIAGLARDGGMADSPGLMALEAGTFGKTQRLSGKNLKIGVIEAKVWQRAGGDITALASNKAASAETLLGLAFDESLSPSIQVAAAETAAKQSILEPSALADIYRRSANAPDPSARGQLFSAAVFERTPFRKVRAIRAFLDDAKKAGLYTHALIIIAPAAADVTPAAEITWFSETAIEAALMAGDVARARQWIEFAARTDPEATGNLDHWAALSDILDPPGKPDREAALKSVEEMALGGRFGSAALHRLATVLDALNFHVPIPLWEAASRTPQPTGGHLPETGVLSELQAASRKKQFGNTILLTMRSIGPGTAEQANMLALGDAIRALKRLGRTEAARQLGFEALFAVWPRRSTG